MTALEPALTTQKAAILLLWQRVNASLSAFYKLIQHFDSAKRALESTPSGWSELKIHAKHVERHRQATDEQDKQFINQINNSITLKHFQVLFQQDAEYPQQLLALYDPPPLLFVRGNSDRLNQSQIAIVGSRKPTANAQKFTFDMAQYLAKSGFVITSGLAQGVDVQAHMGALSQPTDCTGRTIGVMGTGIDIYYPKQHQALFDRIINEGGCIISELLPGTPPNKHTFPRRNRLVAGLSLGTIVTEAQIKSGSLITARLTSEQGKQVFAMPSTVDNMNAEGCHHLIREGATLIYHPEQVINDLSHQLITPIQRRSISQSIQASGHSSDAFDLSHAGVSKSDTPDNYGLDRRQLMDENNVLDKNEQDLPQVEASISSLNSTFDAPTATDSHNVSRTQKQMPSQPPASLDIPKHLQSLWSHIDFDGQDLDALVQKTHMDTATLLGQLMELELMGGLTEIGGRYKRL